MLWRHFSELMSFYFKMTVTAQQLFVVMMMMMMMMIMIMIMMVVSAILSGLWWTLLSQRFLKELFLTCTSCSSCKYQMHNDSLHFLIMACVWKKCEDCSVCQLRVWAVCSVMCISDRPSIYRLPTLTQQQCFCPPSVCVRKTQERSLFSNDSTPVLQSLKQ